MPKKKKHGSTKKRFKVTGTGKVLRDRTGKNHLLEKKGESRKRRANTSAEVTGALKKNIKRALGV
ncbi:ribosomal protein L35 [candidate division TM7 genomosp. GTL1]|nr:ribosomal protein L35 [candidate division TM7 genomosp. GTL1]